MLSQFIRSAISTSAGAYDPGHPGEVHLRSEREQSTLMHGNSGGEISVMQVCGFQAPSVFRQLLGFLERIGIWGQHTPSL
jgi:hypothetical protein